MQHKISTHGTPESYVEIKVVHSQSVKGLLQPFFHVGMVCVPKLAGEEDFFAWHPAVLDPLTDFVLIAWEYY